jgi:hypothetical protein
MLVTELDPELDAAYTAHALLAPLGADLNRMLLDHFDFDRIRAGLDALIARLSG